MNKLKPCPICGGRFQPFKDNYGKYGAYCPECGMYFGVALECGVELHDGWKAQFDSEEALTDALNRRDQTAADSLPCDGCDSAYTEESCEYCSRALRNDLYRPLEGCENE